MSQLWSDAVREKHMRAICDEIGERLRFVLDRTAQEPSAQLVALIRRFEQLEHTEAPSIAPSLEELSGNEKAPSALGFANGA
jgi:hypothetical protein